MEGPPVSLTPAQVCDRGQYESPLSLWELAVKGKFEVDSPSRATLPNRIHQGAEWTHTHETMHAGRGWAFSRMHVTRPLGGRYGVPRGSVDSLPHPTHRPFQSDWPESMVPLDVTHPIRILVSLRSAVRSPSFDAGIRSAGWLLPLLQQESEHTTIHTRPTRACRTHARHAHAVDGRHVVAHVRAQGKEQDAQHEEPQAGRVSAHPDTVCH